MIVNLQTFLQGVGQVERYGEGRKNEIDELGASGREAVNEGRSGLGEEVGEVVHKKEEDSFGSDVESSSGVGQGSKT